MSYHRKMLWGCSAEWRSLHTQCAVCLPHIILVGARARKYPRSAPRLGMSSREGPCQVRQLNVIESWSGPLHKIRTTKGGEKQFNGLNQKSSTTMLRLFTFSAIAIQHVQCLETNLWIHLRTLPKEVFQMIVVLTECKSLFFLVHQRCFSLQLNSHLHWNSTGSLWRKPCHHALLGWLLFLP